ncbi:HisA/HisF-related TIM barrel protein [Methylomarinum vadi]|uniref:HisA/HisF-related TIM barrel protein n=1 Tax=Methylomarinum vadi TaxID=438855 RepID=UPI0004DEFE48|nr:HisA/HisF-related TIM barrel protein [Methylomarinum vadi]
MQIIPVIDLKDGHVVHARHGDRDRYQPLKTPLCSSSSLCAVMETFLDLHDFDTFYIADLNAITRQGDHAEQIHELSDRYGNIQFWLDNGSQLMEVDEPRASNLTPVIGTESQHHLGVKPRQNYILSLDFTGEERLGHPLLFENKDVWPQNVIIMTLARVGSHSGPDTVKLAEYKKKHPDKQFIAAGGVRDGNDLKRLIDIGIDKALVASALHSRAITGEDIKKLQTKKYPV